jgi:ssRNA-specific RNase YbeY (16S rRNA maturation enzyme)
LLIHGILHLLHYDHERSSEEAALMRQEEERLLSLIKD